MILLFCIFSLGYITFQRISIIKNSSLIAEFEEIEVVSNYHSPTIFKGSLVNGLDKCDRFPIIKEIFIEKCFLLLFTNSRCSFNHQIRNAERQGYRAIIYVSLTENPEHNSTYLDTQRKADLFVVLVSIKNGQLLTNYTYAGGFEIKFNDRRWSAMSYIKISVLVLSIGMELYFISLFVAHKIRFYMRKFLKILERRKIYKIPTRTVTVVNMDKECPLCFDVYAVDDVISVLNCHHEFHQKCLYFLAEGMCPLCRIPLNKVIKVEKIPSTNLDRTKQARHNESIPLLCLDNNCQNDIDEIVQKGSPDLFNTIKIELPSKNSNEPYRL